MGNCTGSVSPKDKRSSSSKSIKNHSLSAQCELNSEEKG